MADIEIKNKKGKQATRSLAKKMIRVDLTPMVDLGFLLITFFVFTTTMSKATVMDIRVPYGEDRSDPVCNSCALTVLLDKNDEVYYYSGAFIKGKLVKSSFSEIREVIQAQKLAVEKTGRNKNQFTLIIKSSDAARFKNFVDITDEVSINSIKRYYIDELTGEEIAEMQGRK
jgi:biopolymer transport protein ExbD